MTTVTYKCKTCGQEKERLIFGDDTPCYADTCCECCKKQGLQSQDCEMALLELDKLANGTKLSDNDVKGILLEKPLSETLDALNILHEHNKYSNIYPNYQNKCPDITIQELDTVIECKNLSKKQVDERLSEAWLDENIIKRPYLVKHRRKIALLSFRPRTSLVHYLNQYGWRVYSLETQILTSKQARKAMGKLKQRFYWLKNEYNKPQ
jgi:hypothetical protein